MTPRDSHPSALQISSPLQGFPSSQETFKSFAKVHSPDDWSQNPLLHAGASSQSPSTPQGIQFSFGSTEHSSPHSPGLHTTTSHGPGGGHAFGHSGARAWYSHWKSTHAIAHKGKSGFPQSDASRQSPGQPGICTPVHSPKRHWSSAVHGSPSSHPTMLSKAFETQRLLTHFSLVHGLLSSQSTALLQEGHAPPNGG